MGNLLDYKSTKYKFFFLEGNKISEIVYVEQIYYWHTQMIKSD